MFNLKVRCYVTCFFDERKVFQLGFRVCSPAKKIFSESEHPPLLILNKTFWAVTCISMKALKFYKRKRNASMFRVTLENKVEY